MAFAATPRVSSCPVAWMPPLSIDGITTRLIISERMTTLLADPYSLRVRGTDNAVRVTMRGHGRTPVPWQGWVQYSRFDCD